MSHHLHCQHFVNVISSLVVPLNSSIPNYLQSQRNQIWLLPNAAEYQLFQKHSLWWYDDQIVGTQVSVYFIGLF